MYQQIHDLIYSPDSDYCDLNKNELLAKIKSLSNEAFTKNNTDALLAVHRILYTINLAHLATPWETLPKNISHPFIVEIKHHIESSWEESEHLKYNSELKQLPDAADFSEWIKQYIQNHSANKLHIMFPFLRDTASFKQLREFFFQETPLEMLFGDILAFMLPGTYGSIKMEFLNNYWDEVGHAQDEKVHRNLRANLMKRIDVPNDCYINQIEYFIVEELELINMYLSMATNRPKHIELIGVMLATELMIPGRFKYQIDGWKRLNIEDNALTYLIEHTTVDEVHAEHWLADVVLPIVNGNPDAIPKIVTGVIRRLNTSENVLNALYKRILQIQ